MKPCTVAVAGKGGTGKTTIAALLVDALVAAGVRPVLAVDADPNANLHEAMGVAVDETLGTMREEAFTRGIPPGMDRRAYIGYRFRKVLVEAGGFDLLAMGRPEGTGCYCFANDLLRECVDSLVQDYRCVVVDAEAGMEHVSRGTVGAPDVLLVVSDPSARGLRTALRIRDLAVSLGLDEGRIFLVVNRSKGEAVADVPLPLAAVVPYDPAVEEADVAGRPVISVPPGSPARAAVEGLRRWVISYTAVRPPSR
ncbi:ATP-binding protein [Methanofollis ethanolicus]|uniref:ATP-binding protein n=1 Tax=Methanofollis ethanolicus TaxID=488124 RepID=UPI0008333C74|nr:AAA family ATPase [Methanofollis ethanolicus]